MRNRKSVRQMNDWELLSHSMQSRVFRLTLLSGVILWIVSLAVGLYLYSRSLVRQYITQSYVLVRSAALLTETAVDEDQFTREVMEIYRSLTPEERAQTGTEAYRQRFAHAAASPAYKILENTLKEFSEASDVRDLYFAVYDRQNLALVYFCDPGPGDSPPEHMPGEWDPLEESALKLFLNWDGKTPMNDQGRTSILGWVCTSGYPLKNADGSVNGYLLGDITMDRIWNGMQVFAVQFTLAMLLVVLLTGLFIARRIKKSHVIPITRISDAAQKYVIDRRNGQTASHFAALDIHTGDEVENLSLIMADMERDLNAYEEDLKRITAEEERIRTELDLAKRIQANMLPRRFPPFPDRKDLDIYASMTPAKEVGGDFYDFFLIDPDHLGMVIADVSGKGIPAALFMMASRILLRQYALSGLKPSQILDAANRQICDNNPEQMFVTVWLGILDLRTGHLVAANAGHEYPVLRQPGEPFALYRDKHGFVLGGMETVRYRDYELDLKEGACLLLYTDGIPEATNARSELFGVPRMLDALNAAPEEDARGLVEHLKQTAQRFSGEASQFDDMTLLAIRYRGNNSLPEEP